MNLESGLKTHERFEAVIRIVTLTFNSTGMILGAGIYFIIGKAADQTGETLWLGFVFAGLSALLTALS